MYPSPISKSDIFHSKVHIHFEYKGQEVPALELPAKTKPLVVVSFLCYRFGKEMASFIAKQLVGKHLDKVKGKVVGTSPIMMIASCIPTLLCLQYISRPVSMN